jgi:hypothetical protein
MTDEIKGREAAYFQQRDRELLEQHRRRQECAAARAHMMRVLGVTDAAAVEAMEAAGYSAGTAPLVFLAPALQVAWSDGGMSEEERRLLLELAATRAIEPGTEAHRQLLAWMEEPPRHEIFRSSLTCLNAMLREHPPQVEALRRDLIACATTIADASGGFLGLGQRTSRAERTVIEQLSAALAA